MGIKGTMKRGAEALLDQRWLKKNIEASRKDFSFHADKFGHTLTEEEKKEIDLFYSKITDEKPVYAYYDIFKYYSGKFNTKFIPDDWARVKLTTYANDPYFIETISDKVFLPTIAKAAGVKMPEPILSVTAGVFYDGDMNVISKKNAKEILKKYDEFIVKPSIDSGGADGCKIYDKQSGYPRITDEVVEEIFHTYKMDFVVQKLIKMYEPLDALCPGAYTSFRLITYVFDGKVQHTPGIFMMGNGSRFSNEPGFTFVGITEEGRLHKYGVTKKGDRDIEHHPTSDVLFENYMIDRYPEIISAAEKIHKYFPRLGIVNWDFTIDKDGDAVLIEGNCRNGNGPFLIQAATGEALFGNNTEEIMKWIKKMDTISVAERYNYRLGEGMQ